MQALNVRIAEASLQQSLVNARTESNVRSSQMRDINLARRGAGEEKRREMAQEKDSARLR